MRHLALAHSISQQSLDLESRLYTKIWSREKEIHKKLKNHRCLGLKGTLHYPVEPACSSPCHCWMRLSHFPKVLCPVSGKFGNRNPVSVSMKLNSFWSLTLINSNFMEFISFLQIMSWKRFSGNPCLPLIWSWFTKQHTLHRETL